jgi:hypothetical protein
LRHLDALQQRAQLLLQLYYVNRLAIFQCSARHGTSSSLQVVSHVKHLLDEPLYPTQDFLTTFVPLATPSSGQSHGYLLLSQQLRLRVQDHNPKPCRV